MEHGPAVPSYILRGHETAIHALHFYADNSLLASGDSEGWLVIWSLSSKRPVAVWNGHKGGILQIKHWTADRLVSHGRDHKIRVWQVRPEDLANLSTKLPAEASSTVPTQPQPWLLHSLSVSALNFCAFSMCPEYGRKEQTVEATSQLIASANGLESGAIDFFQLPSERRVSQIKSDKHNPTGMVMAVALFHQEEESSPKLVLVSGYEDGRVLVHIHHGVLTDPAEARRWQTTMSCKAHTQPVLSLDILPLRTHFLSSSADATIAKFSLLSLSARATIEEQPEKTANTKHAGQQGLSIRSDGKIFATAGWDGRVRVYSCKTVKELAVLKWHKVGIYSIAIADVDVGSRDDTRPNDSSKHGVSSGTKLPTTSNEITKNMNALDLIKQRREKKARHTHWLAAGGKDGKISLWDIY